MVKRAILILFMALACFSLAYSQPTLKYYIRSSLGEPWDPGWCPIPNTNQLTMNTAFGAGGWTLAYYETAVPATVFGANTCFVFMEGGENQANIMENFLIANMTTIQNFVTNGGNVLMNAAPNVGDGMSFGFGGVSLVYPYYASTVYQTGPHSIFVGPFTPVASASYSGTYYGHARISGVGLTSVIRDASFNMILAEKAWGSGHAMFGGMTTVGWHSPYTQAYNLRANMYSYLAAFCAIVLPVQFTDFKANEQNGRVRLDWETSSETNSDYFTIERSTNCLAWQAIGTVKAAGNSTTLLNYVFYDEEPFLGKSYYRIQQTDQDGNSDYSPIDDVEITDDTRVFPIPAVEQVTINFTKSTDKEIHILNAVGEPVQCNVTPGVYSYSFDIQALPKGMYFFEIISGDNKSYKEFIKQ